MFLAIWSIGFGYGFWWSLISGEEATRTGLAGLQEDARDASAVVAARLDAVRGQLDSVVTWSDGQMSREETSGGSCGTASGAGRGPLYNARRSVRDSDHHPARGHDPVLARARAGRRRAAQAERRRARRRHGRGAAAGLRGQGLRHPRPGAQHRRAQQPARQVDRRRDARASPVRLRSPPAQRGFSCYDPTLAERLRQAAAQAEQPAELKLREAVFNEGPAGVANAVKNLWRNIGAYASSLAAYVFSGGKQTVGHTDSGEPITGRDLIALLATIGIDLGLLALAILNPPQEPPSIRPPARSAGRSRTPSIRPSRARASTTNGCTGISSTTTRRPIS